MTLAYYDDENNSNSPLGLIGEGLSKAAGAIFAVLALIFTLALWTYSINDPSMMNTTDALPENALGRAGAFFADPALRIFGRGVWVIPVVLAAWAVRIFLGINSTNYFSRLIFLPLAVLLGSVFAATHSLNSSWPFGAEIGMGGALGDVVLGGLITALPFASGFSLFILSLILGVLSITSLVFVCGASIDGTKSAIGKVIHDARLFFGIVLALIVGFVMQAFSRVKNTRATTHNRDHEKHSTSEPTTFSPGSYVPAEDNRPVSQRISDIVARKTAQHQELLARSGITDSGKPTDVATAVTLDEPSQTRSSIAGKIPAMLRREPLVQSPTKSAPISERAKKEAQPDFTFEAPVEPAFDMPSLSLLQNPDVITRYVPPREAMEASARQLEAVLEDYGVRGEIVAVKPGPVVTMYELEPAAGLKASRVIGLADDIARSMSALTARVATIPGRSVIGIELPNETREMVLLREIFAAKNYGDSKLPLPLALGKDIAGEPIVANLAKMPHLLIAGTTGSGKSVAINTMILSLLYHASPEDVRMIMIDPKMLELSVYDDIPHLLSPVVTDPKKAVVALKWVVSEMEERYRKMSKMGVRNIDGYNERVVEALRSGEGFSRTVQTGFDDLTSEPVFETEEYTPVKIPYIVVVVDEMADLMMVAGKEIEACIQRLAQMARASGIHLIMATQRPSVDVITGTIKANFPTRISFQVTSKIDSRTILGEMGAEQLLGQGDMLYMSGGGRITRVHAPFVSDGEVEEIVRHLKAQGAPEYHSGVTEGPEDDQASAIDEVLGLATGDGEDALYDQAVMIVARDRKCSTSYIQRKLSIGYNKAAKLVERMEEQQVVSEANHVGKREILVPELR